MKNKNIKDKDIDGIVEVLDKIFNVSIVEQGQDFNIYKIGIWLNGLEINNNEIEINTVDDKIEKLKKYIATKILSKLKENEIVLAEGKVEEQENLGEYRIGDMWDEDIILKILDKEGMEIRLILEVINNEK